MKTALQWFRLGRVPKKSATGVEMWSNRYCQHSFIYYTETETRPVNDRDKERIRKARLKKSKERAEKWHAEREAQIAEMEFQAQEFEEHFNNVLDAYTESFKAVSSVSNGIVIECRTNGNTVGFDSPDLKITSLALISVDGKIRLHIEDFEDANCGKIEAINNILSSASCYIGYNLDFHEKMLKKYGFKLSKKETFCVMNMFAILHSYYSDSMSWWRFRPQIECAEYCNVNYDKNNALINAEQVKFSFALLIGQMMQIKGEE